MAAVALDHTARSRRVAVAGMSARRTQRAFTLDDEDDDYDVSYVPGISAPPDASTSPRSPAKAAVASHIGSGALIRSTTAAERIQGRFRTWMREKRERLRSAAARVGAAAAASSSSAGGAAGGAPSTPRPPPAQRYARIDSDSDSDSDHEDTRAARAKHHRAASAGAGRPAGHAPTADGVAADDRPADDDEHSPRRKLVKCSLLTLAWFGLSTCLALFNKALFGQRKGGFPAPLLLTSVQFLMQYLIAAATLRFVLPRMRPRRPIPWGVYLRQVAPVGVVMGMDIGLSNLSLVYVTVSFYTLAKTSSILFLLAFAFWLRLEPVSLRLTAAALTLTLGEVLTVQGETQFNALGFFLVIAAAACSGLRWVLSQRVLHAKNGLEGTGLRRSHGMHNPPAMLRTMMPVMCGVVFVFSCFQEDWWDTVPGSPWLDDPSDLFVDGGITLLGALMAFCMSMAEFELLKETSAVTVMVIGTAKDVVTVACSIVIFGDVFGWENFFGMCFVLAGIAAYNYHKVLCAREEREAEEAALATEMVVMGGGGTAGAADTAGVGVVGGVSANGATNGEYVPTVTMRKFGSSTPRLPTRRD